MVVLNFIFLFFWWEKREGVIKFRLREKKWSLEKISATKTVSTIKKFHMMKEVMIMCVVYLENTNKNRYKLKKIFFYNGFQVLDDFLMAMN
jgi:hypothetical protein